MSVKAAMPQIDLDLTQLGSSAMDEFLTIAEIAELLKLNQMTVRNWIFSPECSGLPVVTGFVGGVLTYRPGARWAWSGSDAARKNRMKSAVSRGARPAGEA
jgi:hypothetical protein